ncbi:MAG: RluA family pseudouridine synthase [Erysipelotrichaceae bacterium]
MREFIIKENDADQRVDKFITKTLNEIPKALMYKYIRNKKIKVNRSRCEISQRLQVGDTIQCYIAEEFFKDEHDYNFLKASSSLDIVYEDDNILIINKPIGLITHSDINETVDTLINRVKHYLYVTKVYNPNEELSFTPALAHRIDRNTEGLVIAAKNAATIRSINNAILEHQIEKTYLCICEGRMPKKQDMLIGYHKKLDNNIAKIIDHCETGYVKVETGYKVLEEKKDYSLCEVNLISGKSHQIRAQFAALKHPLLSDIKYGAQQTEFKYQALCAYKVKFNFENDHFLAYLNKKEIFISKPLLLQYFNSKLN